MQLIKWNKVLESFEKQNPRAFDYFYHFHYIHDLREGDLSPYERLGQIAKYSAGDSDQIIENLKAAALACVPSSDTGSAEISEEGVLITLL